MLRKHLHEIVDSILDSIEYDTEGNAVNQISLEHKRETQRLSTGFDREVLFPTGETCVTLRIEPSVLQFQKNLAEAIAQADSEDVVKHVGKFTPEQAAVVCKAHGGEGVVVVNTAAVRKLSLAAEMVGGALPIYDGLPPSVKTE
jgi:hypothetical protein